MKIALMVAVCAWTQPAGFSIIAEAQRTKTAAAHEHWIPATNTHLYARDIGKGTPLIVLHGGPDFDHTYLLPELDRLTNAYHLIYYDQRGRGRSQENVKPEDVTLASDADDLDQVRRYFKLDKVVLLGHSWGTVVALEYAIRHPEHVSGMILMNPAPASAEDFQELRKSRLEKLGSDAERLNAIRASDAYKKGDPDAVADYYAIHFKQALVKPEDLQKLIVRLRASFTAEGVLKARAVEAHLVDESWLAPSWNLMPQIRSLKIPTLVIYSDHDSIPVATAEHITQAIPNARMVTMRACGHFPYMECPGEVRPAIDGFLRMK